MKKNLTRAMALGMVMTVMAGTTAFANEPMLISENPTANELTTKVDKMKAEASQFLTQAGTVEFIDVVDGVSIVQIANEQGGLRFAVAADTIIVNRENGAYMMANELTEGMAVTVVYDMNSPMGMSMPPYLGSVAAVVANSDAGNVTVGKFGEDLTDWSQKLQLNIDGTTAIKNMQGSRIRLFAEDVKGQDALVFYGMTTRSIPAQTTPSFILILETEAPIAEESGARAVKTAEAVALRDAAEELGFTVTWQGKAMPVLVEKDGVSMEVIIGEDDYTVNGEAKEASMKAELKDGVMFVSSELFA